MSRLFYHVMQDNVGNLLFGVSGTMRIAGTGTLATIYGDEALTVILPNPMTNHVNFGSFKCFLGAGDYDFSMAKAGYTFETLTGVQGHGTMAQQDANAVAITGGSLVGLTQVGIGTPNPIGSLHVFGGNTVLDGSLVVDTSTLVVDSVTNRVGVGGVTSPGSALDVGGNITARTSLIVDNTTLIVDSTSHTVGIKRTPRANVTLDILWPKTTDTAGIYLQQGANDAGLEPAVVFVNSATVTVGSITTTASATAYNTASDGRLKYGVEALAGALDVVRALHPITHRWRADDSPGVGFLAHEVQEVVGGVVTGEKDAVDEAGQIVPQQMDYSKLVPWLVSAVKELTQQVEMLQAQLEAAHA